MCLCLTLWHEKDNKSRQEKDRREGLQNKTQCSNICSIMWGHLKQRSTWYT